MITVGPATAQRVVLYAGEALHPATGRRIHVLGFQARLVNAFHRANAVVLPVPAVAPLGPDNVIPTPACALDDMAETLRQMDPNRGFERPDVRVLPRGRLAVTLARADAVVGALESLPADLRPPVDRAFFRGLAKRYPGAQVVLCCWAGGVDAEPVFVWYEPSRTGALFLPTITAVGADAPQLVGRDHTLVIGSGIRPFGVPVRSLGALPAPLAPTIWGKVMKGEHPNVDYDVDVGQLHELQNVTGRFDLHARLDPKLWSLRFEPRAPR